MTVRIILCDDHKIVRAGIRQLIEEANADIDKKEKEKIDKLNQADALVFTTEKQIKEFDEKLSDEDKNNLQENL
jgi:molecular chaperone DnaK (HSP70)